MHVQTLLARYGTVRLTPRAPPTHPYQVQQAQAKLTAAKDRASELKKKLDNKAAKRAGGEQGEGPPPPVAKPAKKPRYRYDPLLCRACQQYQRVQNGKSRRFLPSTKPPASTVGEGCEGQVGLPLWQAKKHSTSDIRFQALQRLAPQDLTTAVGTQFSANVLLLAKTTS